MPWICEHGKRIGCDWQECPLCLKERRDSQHSEQQPDTLKRIQDENRRLREEIERLRKSR
jgi:hypothetical protein